jgi:hypothetical protein
MGVTFPTVWPYLGLIKNTGPGEAVRKVAVEASLHRGGSSVFVQAKM